MPRFDGADLSHHNADAGPIDWATLRSSSSWVATKATQGTGTVDPTFHAHRAQMGAQRFDHRLYYHWLSPQRSWLWGDFARRPEDQAAHYLRTVGTLHPGEGAMLDAEEAGITVADVLVWCEAVEDDTHRPASIYTGAYVAGGTIWQSTAVRHSDYGPRPMHLAAYTTEAKALALPGVKAYPWDAWQFSSNGPVPGVIGRCDMNRIDDIFVYDLACAVAAQPVPPPPQPPLEDDMPHVLFDLADVATTLWGTADRPGGLVMVVHWSGPGNDEWLATRRLMLDFGAEERPASVGNFRHARLDGPKPPTMLAEHFANTDEILAAEAPVAAVDETARSGVEFVRNEQRAMADRFDRLRDAQLGAWMGG